MSATATAAAFWTRATPDVVDRRAEFDWHDSADDKETVTMGAAERAVLALLRPEPAAKGTVALAAPAVEDPAADEPEAELSAPILALSASVAGFLLVGGLAACSMASVLFVSLGLAQL